MGFLLGSAGPNVKCAGPNPNLPGPNKAPMRRMRELLENGELQVQQVEVSSSRRRLTVGAAVVYVALGSEKK